MPADCGFFSKHICKKYGFWPNFTISGINAGLNLGPDMQFSGTLVAAMSAEQDVPAMAMSNFSYRHTQLDHYNEITLKLVKWFSQIKLPRNTLINVNFPEISVPKGVKYYKVQNECNSQFKAELCGDGEYKI